MYRRSLFVCCSSWHVAKVRSVGPLPLSHNCSNAAGGGADAAASPVADLYEAVMRHPTSTSVLGGSLPSAIGMLSGLALFGLTFGYHIGSPVLEAYGITNDDDEDEKDDDEDEEGEK